MRFTKKMPVFLRLLLIGAIPLALLGAIVGFLSYQYSRDIVNETEKIAISDTINRIDININVKMRQLWMVTDLLAKSTQLQDLLDVPDASSEEKLDFKQFCHEIIRSTPEISEIYILDEQQQAASMNNKTLSEDVIGELYRRAEDVWDTTQTFYPRMIYLDYTNEFFVIDTVSAQATEKKVLVVLGLSLEQLNVQILTRQTVLDGQVLFLVNNSGHVMMQNRYVDDALVQSALAQYRQGARKYYIDDSDINYVASQYNALSGLTIFTAIPNSALFPEGGALRTYIVIMVCVAILISIIALSFLSTTIVYPLKKLTKGLQEVANERYDIRLENNRGDEIGKMTIAFNSMASKIQYLINEVYQKQLDVKTAEFKALQAQINPHFLYNALDSLNWMLIEHEELEISSMIVSLGNILRYAMDTETSTVAIQDEYEYIQRYLDVQKMRLEDRLQVHLSLQPEVEEFRIPKLTIQPFVENAIKYGVESESRSVNVYVQAYQKDGYVEIVIDDDGRGMDEERITFYRTLLASQNVSTKRIGVQNAVRRLQYYFKDSCVFTAHSHSQRGLRVEIKIPKEEVVNENHCGR